MGPFEITALDALRLRNGLMQLAAGDEAKADRVLARVRLVEGIANTETSLLLSTHKL